MALKARNGKSGCWQGMLSLKAIKKSLSLLLVVASNAECYLPVAASPHSVSHVIFTPVGMPVPTFCLIGAPVVTLGTSNLV